MVCSGTLRLCLLVWGCALGSATPVPSRVSVLATHRDGNRHNKGGEPTVAQELGIVTERETEHGPVPTTPTTPPDAPSSEQMGTVKKALNELAPSSEPPTIPVQLGNGKASQQSQRAKMASQSSSVESPAVSPTLLSAGTTGMPAPSDTSERAALKSGTASPVKKRLLSHGMTPPIQTDNAPVLREEAGGEGATEESPTPEGGLQELEDGLEVGSLSLEQKVFSGPLWAPTDKTTMPVPVRSSATELSDKSGKKQAGVVRTAGTKNLTTVSPAQNSSALVKAEEETDDTTKQGSPAPTKIDSHKTGQQKTEEGGAMEGPKGREMGALDVSAIQSPTVQESNVATGNVQDLGVQGGEEGELDVQPSEEEGAVEQASLIRQSFPTNIPDSTKTAAISDGRSSINDSSSPLDPEAEERQTAVLDGSQRSSSPVPEPTEGRANDAPSNPGPDLSPSAPPGLMTGEGESSLKPSTSNELRLASPTPTVPPAGRLEPSAGPVEEKLLLNSVSPWIEDEDENPSVSSAVTAKDNTPPSPVSAVNPSQHFHVTAETVAKAWSQSAIGGPTAGQEGDGMQLSEGLPLLFEPAVTTLPDSTPLQPEAFITMLPDGDPLDPQSLVTAASSGIPLASDLTGTAIFNEDLSLAESSVTELPEEVPQAWQTAGVDLFEGVTPPEMVSLTAPTGPPTGSGAPDSEELDMIGDPGEVLPMTTESPLPGTSPGKLFLTTVARATSLSTPKPESGLEDLEKLESEEEHDEEDEEDEDAEESEEEESREDEPETEGPGVTAVPPTFSHTPYRLPTGSEWVQRNQGLVRSWVEKIRDKAGYVSGMLAPVGIGITGALFILGALYSIKVMHRKRRSSFKRQRRKHREMSSRQDRVMLLADSSEDEF
ncbi:uncharacterized protein armh4 [Amia ocellicauda]|uniref:uncharacterized protein armh4 n=1 Tax=Amia ocellicauda TaxID=2972642 RepID=UPI00346494C6